MGEEDLKSFWHVRKKLIEYLGIKEYEIVHEGRVTGNNRFKIIGKAEEEGIYLYVFKKVNAGIRVELKTKIDKGTGGRRRSFCMELANKGFVFVKLEVTKNKISRTMGFLCCHNSCNNASHNSLDFQEADKTVTEEKCDVVFSFGDFNPRVECEESDKGWIRQIEGTEYRPLVKSLNKIIRDPWDATMFATS